MGAGGCIVTQQTQNKAKRVIGGCARHNCGQACGGGGNGHKDDVITTRPPQIIWGNIGGVSGSQAPPIHARTVCDVYSHEKTTKKAKANKLPGVRKLGKLLVRKTNSKIVKKNREKNKKTEQEAQHEAKCT